MRTLLYIGHHKVGSTALQTFFATNSRRLLEHGILYPAVETEGLTYLLKKVRLRKDHLEPLRLNIREPHNALAFRMLAQKDGRHVPPFHPNLPSVHQMALAIENQIHSLLPHTVVFCSEVMANFGAEGHELIEELMEIVPTRVLTLYCALRQPDEYLVSWHGQRLKFGHKFQPLRKEAAQQYFNTIHFDYQKMLRPWVEHCKSAKLIVRNYHNVVAAGGSIDDFCDQTDLNLPSKLLPVGKANPSIPHALMEITRLANQHLPRPDATSFRQFVLSNIHRMHLAKNGSVEMYGAENRALMQARFEPVEMYLRELTGQKRFFDLDAITKLAPISEQDAATDAFEQLMAIVSPSDMTQPVQSFLKSEPLKTIF